MQPILIKEYMPGANVTSDEDILNYIMKSAYQNWHASCTCTCPADNLTTSEHADKCSSGRMGKIDDPMAVVDSKARVIGVKGLRVVDASSFALLPPGHPQSTICEFEPDPVPTQYEG